MFLAFVIFSCRLVRLFFCLALVLAAKPNIIPNSCNDIGRIPNMYYAHKRYTHSYDCCRSFSLAACFFLSPVSIESVYGRHENMPFDYTNWKCILRFSPPLPLSLFSDPLPSFPLPLYLSLSLPLSISPSLSPPPSTPPLYPSPPLSLLKANLRHKSIRISRDWATKAYIHAPGSFDLDVRFRVLH